MYQWAAEAEVEVRVGFGRRAMVENEAESAS
jgi:hypothetical protein